MAEAEAASTDIALSDAALIVLRDLDDADGRTVLKAAIKELVAAGTWRVHPRESRKRKRRSRPRSAVLLVPGDQSPPAAPPLPSVSQLIEAAPTMTRDGEIVRDLRAVAQHIEQTHGSIGKQLVGAQLARLLDAGLVEIERRRVRGIPRTRWSRTAEGNRRLADETVRRDERVAAGYLAAVGVNEFDSSFERSVQRRAESAAGSDFDSSFDSAFDVRGGGGDGFGFDGGGGGDGGGG